jgi:hypothetical protein
MCCAALQVVISAAVRGCGTLNYSDGQKRGLQMACKRCELSYSAATSRKYFVSS